MRNANICAMCKQKIVGKFWRYSNQKCYCAVCHSQVKKCSSCNIPVYKGLKQKNKLYCNNCVNKAARCSYCHKHIFGKFWKIAKNILCLECHKKIPRCTKCDMPTKEYLEIKKQILCLPCSEKVEYCAKCRIPLLSNFFRFANDKRKFCSTCVKTKDCCDTCNTPITGKYYQIGDKRNLCSKCMKTAIRTSEAAKKILKKVSNFVKKYNMNISLSTKLELVDALTLAKIRKKNSVYYGAKDRRALGLFVQKGKNYQVYIESLLPYSLCMGVLAHEYTHAWQADNFTKKASLLILEGLAEWISYKTLIFYGYKKEAYAITKQRDIYGQGFHKICNIEKKYGAAKVLQIVKKMVNTN